MFIATLVAAGALEARTLTGACARIDGRAGPIRDGRASDIAFDGDPARARAALERLDGVDVVVQRAAERHRRLLVADMDSTMITVECIDELADYAGLKPQVAAITEAAMRGELDFAAALDARVALLEGLNEATVHACLDDRVVPTPGAAKLIRDFRAAGGRAVLVSGGFTHFAEPVARTLGFDRVVANRLEVTHGRLTGRVEPPIVDSGRKRAVLEEERDALGLLSRDTLAIGDGANDIAMIEAAGLGVAYRAKPRTEAAADVRIRHGDLSVLRYALGLDRAA